MFEKFKMAASETLSRAPIGKIARAAVISLGVPLALSGCAAYLAPPSYGYYGGGYPSYGGGYGYEPLYPFITGGNIYSHPRWHHYRR